MQALIAWAVHTLRQRPRAQTALITSLESRGLLSSVKEATPHTLLFFYFQELRRKKQRSQRAEHAGLSKIMPAQDTICLLGQERVNFCP